MKDNLIKTLGVLLVTGGICVGIAYWVQKNSPPTDLSSSLLKSFADKDADRDGLSDNLESVYGTDYMDSDSDGDGYLDGEEVLSGYDPLKPAPNDQLGAASVMPRPAAGSIKDLNFTSDLVNRLTDKITSGDIQPKKISSGATSIANPASVEEAMESALVRSYQEFSLPNIPSEQINIALDNNKEAVIKYAREISNLLAPINNISSIDIDEGKKNIVDLVAICEETAASIKKLKVPSNLTGVHKKQIGLLIIQANILKAIAGIQEDPLKANIAIAKIEETNQIATEILNEIGNIVAN